MTTYIFDRNPRYGEYGILGDLDPNGEYSEPEYDRLRDLYAAAITEMIAGFDPTLIWQPATAEILCTNETTTTVEDFREWWEETVLNGGFEDALHSAWETVDAEREAATPATTTVRFEIKRESFEFRFGRYRESIPSLTSEEIFEMYEAGSWHDPETVATFDTLEAAKEEFARVYSKWGRTCAEKGSIWWMLTGDVCWIEANIYDEDGEYISWDGTYDVAAEPYTAEEEEE